jgi:hypothetical protein
LTAVRSGAKPDFLSYGMTVADFDAERDPTIVEENAA